MYSKDELLSKNIAELEEIAEQTGVKIKSSDSQEDIIYSILDKQAEVEGNKNPLGTKRRRTRIVKKDMDRVYSVNGKEGENFDLKKNKVAAETPSLFADVPAIAPTKTKRTKSKEKAEIPEEAAATLNNPVSAAVVEEQNTEEAQLPKTDITTDNQAKEVDMPQTEDLPFAESLPHAEDNGMSVVPQA